MERLINSRRGLTLAVSVARATPPWLGYTIARLAARWISSQRDSALVRAVRTNQWVVTGETLTPEALDQAVQAVFLNSARSIYELYHYVHDPVTASQLISIDPSARKIIDRPKFDQRGLVVAGLHKGNFDLIFQWLCINGFDPLALTIPNPEGGRQLEFEFRNRTGMNLVPGSMNGLRKAVRYLRQGGMVVTGIDRPQEEIKVQPHFFGRPANLPTHHIYLALKTQTPIIIVFSHREPDGKYHVFASSPIEMDHFPGREEELLYNGEKVLAVAESFIRQTPQQWVINKPVWPETINQVPS
jgi:lauroyl/myristoyl acyltransferase